MMYEVSLKEDPYIKPLLRPELTADVKWHSDIQPISKDAMKIIRFFVRLQEVADSPCYNPALQEPDQTKKM